MGIELSDLVEIITGKKNVLVTSIFSFPTMFSKAVLMRQNEYLWSKGLLNNSFIWKKKKKTALNVILT